MTIKEATELWVNRDMNAFPNSMIDTLMTYDIDSWHEVTTKTIGDRVYCFDYGSGEIYDYDDKTDMFIVELDNEEKIQVSDYDMEIESDSFLPAWGTLWNFDDNYDNYWLEEQDGIQKMSKCGFRIYEHEEWGYFFGIDGAGYDFYEGHWIPLYKARGLKWHDEV